MKNRGKFEAAILITILVSITVFLGSIERQKLVGTALARTKITVIDSIERKVTLSYPIERIVITDDTVADAVRLFGRQSQVVGIEGSIPGRGYFPEMSDKPVTGGQWSGLNWEKVLELKPDVILISDHPACTPKITEQANKLNIPVVVLRWRFPEGQDETVRILGEIFGEEERATEFIQWKNSNLEMIRERVNDLGEKEKLRAYLEVAFSGPVGRAAGRGKPAGQVMEMAGLRNICEFQRNKEVSSEWIMEQNPDIIIMCDYAGGAGGITGYLATDTWKITEYLKGVKEQTKFKLTNAVKKNNVYLMNTKLRGSMHLIGVLYLAKAAYPERFKDLEPEKVHKEFFERWMGVSYQGTWFYPQPWK